MKPTFKTKENLIKVYSTYADLKAANPIYEGPANSNANKSMWNLNNDKSFTQLLGQRQPNTQIDKLSLSAAIANHESFSTPFSV